MSTTTPASATSTAPAGKYLTLTVATEAYGIPVTAVREIFRHQKITPVPQLPPWMKGVINLRGRVIPIVDLRVKFGLPDALTEMTCIVVVQVKLADERSVQMGLVVDSVEEVATLSANDIEPTPEFGGRIDTTYLRGMAKVKGQVKTLLDIDRIIAAETITHVLQAAS